jgi:uncharacterized membrane protein
VSGGSARTRPPLPCLLGSRLAGADDSHNGRPGYRLPPISALVGRIETGTGLDRAGAPLNAALHRFLRPGLLVDGLSGKKVGYPAHPALVSAPLGCWTGALVADFAGEARAGRLLTGLGVLTALPVAATGASDWADTSGAEQRVGLVHLGVNLSATALYAASWWARRGGRRHTGISLGLAGALMAVAGGWLGGHLAYALGVGVDTNAFHGGPSDWTPVDCSPASSGPLRKGSAAEVSLLVVPPNDGQPDFPRILANRCSHRGGPLVEGQIEGDCVRCPWHGSRFDLTTGQVRTGPATMPQPVYQVRTHDGDLQVRRDEPRTLRVNPVRP